MAAKKLIITQTCVIGGGKVAARGEQVTVENEADVYSLIAAGRALDLSTAEGKQVAAEIEAEKEESAPKKK